MMHVLSVERIGEGLFEILVGDGSKKYRTTCTLSEAKELGDGIRIMNFGSDEFRDLIMRGKVDFDEIRERINALSKC